MRWHLVVVGLVVLVAVTGVGPPPRAPMRPSKGEREKLLAELEKLSAAGVAAAQRGQAREAAKAFEAALELARRLYPKADYPDGHDNLAASLGNIGHLLQARSRLAEAEPYYREALAMRRRLHKGDHPGLALSINNLGLLLEARGKLDEAERHLRESHGMVKRLYKGDHPHMAASLSNLGMLLDARGKLAEAEPYYREALAMLRRLHKGDHPGVATALGNLGEFLRAQSRLADAEQCHRDALAMQRRLHKGDHPDVATGLRQLGGVLGARGRLVEAEPYQRESLAMLKRLHGSDHRAVALSLASLGALLKARGRLAGAEKHHRDALAMLNRLHKGDHRDVAASLNNLAALLQDRGQLVEAELYFRDSLAMRRRLYKGDHPSLAVGLSQMGYLYQARGKLAEAEKLHRDALAMLKRLHKGDHASLAVSLCRLGAALEARGQIAEAEPFHRDALAMQRRLHKGDHPDVALGLSHVGYLKMVLGQAADVGPVLRESLAMYRRLGEAFAARQAEGEALTLAATFPPLRDAYLSFTRPRGEAATAYAEVWAGKGAVSRVYEHRHLAAQAATDPKAARILASLTDARRRRAELLLARQPADPATRRRRDGDLEALGEGIARLERELRPLLPALPRTEGLAKATPADLQKALPAGAALVDFLAYTFFEQDKDKPGSAGLKRTRSYVAFVLTRDKVSRVELGEAKPIEDAVRLWREAITTSASVPADVAARVRRLAWEKVRKELPSGTRAVYLSPDLGLTALPWAALPGDRPGAVLLEDYALAVVPHAPFLLDKLRPQERRPRGPEGVLAVGGVAFDGRAVRPAGHAGIPAANYDGPALKEGQGISWPPLGWTQPEADGVAALARGRKLAPRVLSGAGASVEGLLAELPKARFAHLATHGFFADKGLRSVLQVDPNLFEVRGGERVGAGALSPMVMSGLVLAGANRAETPGRGLLTGEALVDCDLSGLELAVLSACETGLGDVAGGEGVFGLQRALHVAGARNVVASLWKVDDQATAALMALFYRNLWSKGLAPVEALRRAQLEVYRNPGQVPELAKGLRGKFVVVKGGQEVKQEAPRAGKDGKAHPRLWAAFALSGPGTLLPEPKGKE